MTTFKKDSLATVEYSVCWNDEKFMHEEQFLARRVNPWRDIFPPRLLSALEGTREGECVSCQFAPGELVAPYRDDLLVRVPLKYFIKRQLHGQKVEPRIGRFYPQGMIAQGLGVFPSDVRPFRVVDMDSETLVADCNHPLACYPIQLQATVQLVQEKQSDTGGQLTHWGEEVCNWGPGMQGPLAGHCFDFSEESFFKRHDELADTEYYSTARLINHIDGTASQNLAGLYGRFLPKEPRVLDLMSSYESHLPQRTGMSVVGLGLNEEEMNNNAALGQVVIHDLNALPRLPDDLGLFDVIVCSLSIEYLTNPITVLRSAYEHLSEEGCILVSFSNRWFPEKAVAGWLDLHEFERMGLVQEFLRQGGFAGKSGSVSVRNDWRPQTDIHFLETRGVSDPVYLVWAYK